MSTAIEFLEKTAKLHSFTAKGMSDFQKMLLSQKDDLAKATAEGAKKMGQQMKGTAKSFKKNKKAMKKLDESVTKKSLGLGVVGGVGGSVATDNMSSRKDDSL